MTEPIPRGIQATLLDYFKDTESFDLKQANELLLEHQNRDVNAESIRARIYEGIDKGLFERVGKGLYTVTRKNEQGHEATCLVMNGNGRDLSMFQDNSLDAIITVIYSLFTMSSLGSLDSIKSKKYALCS